MQDKTYLLAASQLFKALLTSSIQQHYSDDKTDFTEHVTDPSRSYQQHTTMFVPSTQKSQEGPEFVQRQDCNSLYISQPAGDLRGQYIQNDGFSQIQYMGGENRTTEQQGRTDRVQLPIQIPPTTGSRFSLQQQPNFGTEVNMQPRLSLNQEHKHEYTSRTGSNSMLLCQEEINKSVILTDEGGPTHLYQQDIRKGSFAPDVESPYQQDNYIGNHPPTESDQRNLFRQNIYEGNLPTAEANPRRLHQQQINIGVLSSAERDHMRPYQQQYNEAIPSPEADPRRMYQPQINDGNLQTAEADHRRLYQPQKNEGVLQSVQADSRRRYQPQIHDRYLPTAEADHMGSNQQPKNEGVLSSTDLDNRHLYQQQMNARNLPPVLDPTCQYQRQMHESVHPHAEGDPTRFFPQQINEGVQSPAGGDPRFLQPLRDPRLPYQYTRSNFSQTQQPRLNFAQTQPRYGYMPQRALLQGQVSQHQHRNVLHPGPNFGGQLQQLPTFRQDYQMEMARQEQYQIQQTGYDQYSRHPPQYGYYENRYGYQQPEVSVHGYLVGDQFIGPTSWNCRMEHHSQHNSLQALEQTDISTDNLIAIRKDISDEEYSGKTKKLKVSKIPKSSTKDTLKAFFENTRKFGGGDIESINYDKKKSTAIITFKGDDGVETVLNKKPISFGDTIVEVEAYLPDELLKNEDPDSDEYNTPPESDSDDESVCAIEVSGLKKATTENTIKFYFEGKNGADADIKKIKRIKENNMYLVTFKNAAAVNTVMEKTHRIDGAELHVKKHVSPKRYRNKVLVSGLNDNTSTDRLMLFFEAKAKTDVETVLLGEEESRKAIVTFAENIDIDEIQMTIIDKLCEGKSLKVQPVESCTLTMKKKSGVQGVTECTMNEEENYFVVYFEDPKDAIVAAQREHTLRGQTISVQLFHDCLGIPVDLHESKFKPLPPVTVENIDKQMVKFMMQSNTSNKELQNHLQSIHAEVHWPTSDDGKVTIHSTLSTSIKEWRKISKTWKEDVLKQFDILIDQLAVNQQTTLQDAWNQVVDKMAQIVTPYSDNLILIFEKQPACEIYIVGIKSDVAKVSQRIKEIIHDITEELNMKKQQMTEEVQLKHHQLLILELTNFPNEVKKKFDNIGVSIDKKNLKITFEGIFNSVVSSKLEMYEFIGNMSSTLLGSRSPEFIHFLDNANVKESVLKRMKDQQCIGVWEVHNRNIILYSTSDEEVSKAADVFKDSIIENTVAIENIQHSVLNSKKWTHHVKDIEFKCCQKSVSVEMVADKQGNIVVLCTSKAECVSIKEGIQEFFDLNTEMKETLQFEKYEFMFLQEHMQDEVENLVMQLKQRNIIVWFKSDHVLVKANEEGIRDAKKRITALIKTIYRGEHSLDKAGLHKLMESDKGNNKLKQIGRKAGVLFITESNISSSKEEAKPRTSSDRRVTFSAAGGVDVIVNAAKSDLIHNGGLAKVLINKGGKGIQLECNQFTKTHGQLSAGEVFCSEPGSLHCKHIIHAVGPKWQGGRNKEEDYLRDCVAASLVETDKRHLSSIAIPALCTGRFAYPASEATNVITESVRDYLKKTKSSCIKKVFLCDIVTDTVDLFIKAGNELFNQHGYATYKKGRQVITTGKIKISIKKEELAKMKVDAIVNTTSKDLQLGKGTVSASLLNHGGSDLQKECSKKYPNGVNYGEVAVTSGAKLQSKIVCHVSLEKWEDDSSIKVCCYC
ncbi:unnamed protein product [Mytilus edulis]|uniref:Macro domain-containing protein n=1 Tax=Mytilus edulis TaxID=6550 RepID=A0A8S3UT67_MYTED|nr:unnamed protein product [Mytilus edulis]